MFLILLLATLFQLIIYEALGSVVKRLLKIELEYLNFIIGYLFSLFVFYFINGYFLINDYSYSIFKDVLFPFYLIIIIGVALLSVRRTSIKLDYLIIIITILYNIHFLSLAYIVPEETATYLSDMHQFHNPSIFQAYTLLYSSLFNLNSTVYTVNVMTFINLFIILYTIYECFCLFFNNRRKCRYAFLFFLLLFTVLNTSVAEIGLSYNAFHFLYHPYTGRAIYLYAIIPFQFALFYRLEKRYELLLLLVNLSAIAFTDISLILQLVLNVSLILTKLFTKTYRGISLQSIILLTIFPLIIHLFVSTKDSDLSLFFMIIISILLAVNMLLNYQHKYQNYRLSSIVLIVFIFTLYVIYSYIYAYLSIRIDRELLSRFWENYRIEWRIILLFYGLSIYALIRLRNEEISIKSLLIYFPIIVFLLIANPITIYMVINQGLNLLYLVYLLPLSFSIVYFFINRSRILEKAIILLLILSISRTIYRPMTPIAQTDQNVYYRINQEVLDISNYLNENPDIKNIIVCNDLVSTITINTDNINLLNNTDDENIYLLEHTVNDKIPFDFINVSETISSKHIDAIIIDKNKMVNDYLKPLSISTVEFAYYVIYLF